MISLITSLYKAERYLPTYLKKVDSFSNLLEKRGISSEVVAIANESSPEERKCLEEAGVSNERMRIFYVPREPLYASWNRGVELAKNEIIGFWNVDDIRYPEAAIEGIRLIKEGAELVYFPFVIKWYISFLGFSVTVRKRRICPPVFERKEFTRSMHCGPFFIFTKSLYKKVGPFDEQFKITGDFDWCIRAAKISEFKLSKENAGEFSVYRSALSSGENPLRETENNIICKRHKILDKVKKVNEKLESTYNINRIFCSNKRF